MACVWLHTLLSAPSLDARDWMRVVIAVTALLTRVISVSPSMAPEPCVPSTPPASCRCCRNIEENCFNEMGSHEVNIHNGQSHWSFSVVLNCLLHENFLVLHINFLVIFGRRWYSGLALWSASLGSWVRISVIRWPLFNIWYHRRVAKDYPNCCHTVLRRD